MKVQYYSDLHLEFSSKLGQQVEISPEADVLVFAGDIHTSPKGLGKFWRRLRNKTDIPILFVPGNHEFYGHNIDEAIDEYYKICDMNKVTYLPLEPITINGYNFIGNTLYSDLSNPTEAINVYSGLPDFKVVYKNGHLISIDDWQQMWLKDVGKLTTKLANFKDKDELEKTVVVTHFSPSFRLNGTRFQKSLLVYGFHSNLDHLLELYPPKLWIYGHTHDIVEIEINNCRIRTNPYGYKNEFWLNLKVKIEDI